MGQRPRTFLDEENSVKEESLIGKIVFINYGPENSVVGLLTNEDSMNYFFDGYYKKWKQWEQFDKSSYTVKHTAIGIREATEFEIKTYNIYKNGGELPDPFNMIKKSRG